MNPRPRVLFVDDDASIRQLVELSLEELDIDLVICSSVAQARQALRQRPARLVITDLMMPVESGFDLLQELADDPSLRAGARLVVFSAGLMNADNRAKLLELDVWRELPKPVSVLDLEACVREGLADDSAGGTAAEEGRGERPDLVPATERADGEVSAVALNFGGDVVMFRAFRDTCLQQFPLDLDAAEHALAGSDASTLRRIAHTLKSVLFTLGREAAAEKARELEAAAAAGDWGQVRSTWPPVRDALRAMLARRR